jgi:hypothetical protein
MFALLKRRTETIIFRHACEFQYLTFSSKQKLKASLLLFPHFKDSVSLWGPAIQLPKSISALWPFAVP